MKLLTTARAAPAPSLVLTIVCAGVVLSSLDLFIVNVALPQIARELPGADLANLSWVLNAYAIVFAVLLVPAGRAADLTSRKGGFLIGVAIFTLASGLCAAADSVGVLVALRVLQAVGAALLVPTSLGLVMAAYSAERRGGAVRTWAGMGGLAAALGPVLGGLLVPGRGARPGPGRPARDRELALGVPGQRAHRYRRPRRRVAGAAR